MDASARAARPGLLADNLRRQAAGADGAFSALARPVPTARQLQDMFSATRGMFSAQPAPRTSLDQVVGPDRSLAIIRGNLELARQVAHRHGAKVNDVLLAVTAAGLRGLLRGRGEPIEDLALPVCVPAAGKPCATRATSLGAGRRPLRVCRGGPRHARDRADHRGLIIWRDCSSPPA